MAARARQATAHDGGWGFPPVLGTRRVPLVEAWLGFIEQFVSPNVS